MSQTDSEVMALLLISRTSNVLSFTTTVNSFLASIEVSNVLRYVSIDNGSDNAVYKASYSPIL